MRYLTKVLLAIAVIFTVFQATNVQAEDLGEVQKERKQVNEKLSQSKSQIDAVISELNNLNEQIEDTKQLLEEKRALVAETQTKMDNTIDEIAVLEDEMAELNEKIDERHEILKERIVSTQKTGGSMSYLEVIFGAQDFGDFISRLSAVTTITNSDADLIANQEKDLQTVETKRNKVVTKLDELNEMKAEQEAAKEQVSTQLATSKQQETDLASKKNELTALVDSLELKDSELAALETDIKEQIEQEREIARQKAAEQQKAEEQRKAEATKKQQAEKRQVASAETTKAAPSESKQSAGATTQQSSEPSGKSFTVNSTAYTANCAGCSGVTATGLNLKQNPGAKVIAVDPSVIPLGSTVYVEGYGYATAADTGGAINGNKIDVFFPNKSSAYSWGRRSVTVTVVN